MPARRRELKPDSKGRYRPYLGFTSNFMLFSSSWGSGYSLSGD